MEEEIYRVQLRPDGKWIARRDDLDRPSIVSNDKEEAVQQVIEIAAIRKAQVLIYDRDGALQPERTYPKRRRAWG